MTFSHHVKVGLIIGARLRLQNVVKCRGKSRKALFVYQYFPQSPSSKLGKSRFLLFNSVT